MEFDTKDRYERQAQRKYNSQGDQPTMESSRGAGWLCKVQQNCKTLLLIFFLTIAPFPACLDSVPYSNPPVSALTSSGYAENSQEGGFRIIERWYSEDHDRLTIGIANMQNLAPANDEGIQAADTIEKNKQKILEAIDLFKKRNVNMIVFPEFCLTGYFWDTPNARPIDSKGLEACWRYMAKGALNAHTDWLKQIQSGLDDTLRYVVITNIREGDPTKGAGPENKFLNSAFVIDRLFQCDDLYSAWNEKHRIYDKTKLPGVEKTYLRSGIDDHLVVHTERWGAFGVAICYDMCFSQIFMEYSMLDRVDFILETASWRGTGRASHGKENYGRMRDYEGNPVIDYYTYGYQWDVMAAAMAATNQVWLIACNAMGNQEMHLQQPNLHIVYEFWGGSGLWAPSGKPLIQGSRNNGEPPEVSDELLVVHHIDIQGGIATARKNYGDYYQDFRYYQSPDPNGRQSTSEIVEIYRPIPGARAHTRMRYFKTE
jgi:predicted amidohydrolase